MYFVTLEAKNIISQFRFAIVDEEDNSISHMCFNVLNDQQFSENIKRFEKVSFEDAEKGIKSGKYAIATILKKGMIDKIRSGQKIDFTIFVNDKYEMAYDIIKNISKNSVEMLISGQNGVFAGENVLNNIDFTKIQNINYTDFYNKYIIASNLNLMSVALKGKDTYFTNEKLSYKKSNVTLVDFYIISLIIIVLFFGNVFIYDFYKKDFNVAIISRLKANNINANIFFLGKIILPSVFTFIIIVISFLIINNEEKFFTGFILLFTSILLINIWSLVCAIYIKNKYNYAIVITSLVLLCTFLNGGILPRSMMPYEVLNIIKYTPYGIIFSLGSTIISKGIDIKMVFLAILYILIPYFMLIRVYEKK